MTRISSISIALLLSACGSGDPTPVDTATHDASDTLGAADTVDTTDIPDTDNTDTLELPELEPLPPDPGSVTVLAGDTDRGTSDGPGHLARFQGVTALCTGDALYVSDTFAGTIRRVDLTTGATTTLAGSPGRFALSDGVGKDARFASPRGLACLPSGDLLVADSGALRRVALDGQTTTVAGFPGTPGFADGPASSARLGYLVHAMATHRDGRIFFTDRSNDALRVVDPDDWSIDTVTTQLDGPGGLALDPARPERVVVADTFANRVVTVDLTSGAITALPLDPAPDTPQAIALDGDTLWVAGFGAELWRYRMSSGRGARVADDFPGTFASMVHVPAADNSVPARLVYAALEPEALRQVLLDTNDDRLLAGPETFTAHRDGPVADARFGLISAVTASGPTLFIGDQFGLRRLRDGAVATLTTEDLLDAGEATPISALYAAPSTNRLWVSLPGTGRVLALDLEAAAFFGPTPAALESLDGFADPAGLVQTDTGLLVAERGAHRLTSITDRSTFAGDGLRGTVDGPLALARFDAPHALAWDAVRKHLWVGQASGHLRLVVSNEVITVLRPGGESGPRDGPLADARLGLPLGLIAGPDLFVLDADPGALRRIVFENDAPARLETLVGGTLLGGMPYPRVTTLEDALLGGLAAGVRLGNDLLVAGDHALYRVDPGDLLRPGSGGPGPGPDTCDFALRLGTGESTFEPMPQTLTLERGGQGLQHLFLSLEAPASSLAPGFHTLSAALYAPNEATPRAHMTLTLPFSSRPPDSATATGILFVIEDPTRVVGPALDLVVTVQTPTSLGCARASIDIRQ